MSSKTLDKISFWSLSLVAILLPVFFLPFLGVSVESAKILLVVLGLALSVIFWAAGRFSDGRVIVPKSLVYTGGLFLVFSFLLASLFSGVKSFSFFGVMIDFGTFWFIFISFMLLLFASILYKEREKGRNLFFAFILASLVSIVFQFFKIIFLSLPSPIDISLGGLDPVNTANLIGSWNNLGIFSAVLVFLSLFSFEFFKFKKEWKNIVVLVSVILGLLMIILVNFSLVWKILGIASLLIFAYKVSISNFKDGQRNFPVVPFAVVLLSLLFLMAGSSLSENLMRLTDIRYIEIGPNFIGALEVNKGVLGSGVSNLFFGVGPNNFDQAWQLYRPGLSINETAFWDLSFISGFGIFQTFLATSGLFGGLAWLSLLGIFFYIGFKFLIKFINKEEAREAIMFFLASFFLFVVSFFYAYGTVLFFLAFIFAGVFIGLATQFKENSNFEFDLFNDPRKSVFAVLLLVLVMLGSAAVSFKFVEKFSSVVYIGQVNKTSDIEMVVDKTQKASLINKNDLYYRTLGQAHLLRLNSLLSKEGDLTEEDKAKITESRDAMIEASKQAVLINPNNYINHLSLARMYSTLASYQVEGAGDQAISSYKAASLLSPNNPGIYAEMGDVYFLQKNYTEVINVAKKAIDLKFNFVKAFWTASNAYKELGNKEEAIKYAEGALQFAGNDPLIINYLNELKGISTTPVVNEEASNTTKENTEKSADKESIESSEE